MTGLYFHLTNTTMKLLGLNRAIFISLLTKLTVMARILLLLMQLMLNNSQKLLKISLRHLYPNKIKKLCQMPFLQSIEIIVIFQIFQIDA